jgi:hypothetical protein
VQLLQLRVTGRPLTHGPFFSGRASLLLELYLRRQLEDLSEDLSEDHLARLPFQRQIAAKKVHCPHHQAGCRWTGELGREEKTLLDHYRGCDDDKLECQRCSASVRVSQAQEHAQQECLIRDPPAAAAPASAAAAAAGAASSGQKRKRDESTKEE